MRTLRGFVVKEIFALTLCLAMSGAAKAQPPTGGTLPPAPAVTQAAPIVDNYEAFSVVNGCRGPLYGFSYLDIPEVQQELKLTPEQITQLNTARGKSVSNSDTIEAAGGRERMAADPMARALYYRLLTVVERGAVADILTEAQLKRHRETCIQWEGISALRRQDVADALHLTPTQRAQITTYGLARENHLKAMFANLNPATMQTAKQVSKPAAKPIKDSAWEDLRLKCRAVLTPAQLKQWQEMNGPVFKWLAHSRGQDYS